MAVVKGNYSYKDLSDINEGDTLDGNFIQTFVTALPDNCIFQNGNFLNIDVTNGTFIDGLTGDIDHCYWNHLPDSEQPLTLPEEVLECRHTVKIIIGDSGTNYIREDIYS